MKEMGPEESSGMMFSLILAISTSTLILFSSENPAGTPSRRCGAPAPGTHEHGGKTSPSGIRRFSLPMIRATSLFGRSRQRGIGFRPDMDYPVYALNYASSQKIALHGDERIFRPDVLRRDIPFSTPLA
jgi:hypothetical protein